MQTNQAVIERIAGDKGIIHELWGGLSLVPYGIYPLLSALAFSQGWLDWRTNDGPPFLGLVVAWLFDRLIRRYYDWKYDFFFELKPPAKESKWSKVEIILAIPILAGLFAVWYADANFHWQVRLMPLFFGLIVCWRGIDWLRKGWGGYGLIHLALGLFPMAVGVLAFLLNISTDNQYFGIDGIYELSTMGVVILAIGLMEHLIFLRVRLPAAE